MCLCEWLKPLLHTDRNHYDRIIHFAFGLLLWYPQKELLERKGKVNDTWAMWLSLIITLALSASYEIIEAITASTVDPTDAAAFLGLQGDPWDSQKDMFMGLAGAAVAMGTAFSASNNPAREGSEGSDLALSIRRVRAVLAGSGAVA